MLNIDFSGFGFLLKMVFLGFLLLRAPRLYRWFCKLKMFIPFVWHDICLKKAQKEQGTLPFGHYGVKMFCGRQGAGKTVGLVWYLEKIREEYPKCQIYTNFDYLHETGSLQSLNDLLTVRNGMDGVVFAIDELQNEFSNAVSKDFPETLLSTITMQRKQRICILASSQVFSRVAKPLREQCYEVIECNTIAHRWTRLKAFDAADYNKVVDNPNPEAKFKLPKVWKDSFVQTDKLRALYDTYKVVERMSRDGFATRLQRM